MDEYTTAPPRPDYPRPQARPVTSRPLPEAAPATTQYAVALAGLVIGLMLWPVGARYTIDGLFWIGNVLLAHLHTPYRIPTPPEWTMYLWLAPLPLICSGVEWRSPVRQTSGRLRATSAHALLIWIVIVGVDFGTTYAGIRNPEPDAWGIAHEIAQSIFISGILGVLFTFLPEWLIRGSVRSLRG